MIKVLENMISSENSLPGLQTCRYTHAEREGEGEKKRERGKRENLISGICSSSYKNIDSTRLGSYSYDLIEPSSVHTGPISKYSHIGGWGFNT